VAEVETLQADQMLEGGEIRELVATEDQCSNAWRHPGQVRQLVVAAGERLQSNDADVCVPLTDVLPAAPAEIL
jgi:hypothetical protein